MFGFLMGTLQQFKQTEEAAKSSVKVETTDLCFLLSLIATYLYMPSLSA